MSRDPLRLGSIGLFGHDWPEAYFPDDLPGDWLLPYYANEYPVALLAPAALDRLCREGDFDDWGELMAEIDDERFRLWIDLRDGAAVGPEGLAALAGRLEGIILDDDGGSPPEGTEDAACFRVRDCWRPDHPAGGPGLLSLAADAEPRRLRGLLEEFDTACRLERPVLFVSAPRAAFETLETLVELMGL